MSIQSRMTDIPERAYRDRQEDINQQVEVDKGRVRSFPIPYVVIAMWSTLATVISFALPLALDLFSSQQAQDFYTAWGMGQSGQLYTNYAGAEGFLYYLLLSVAGGGVLVAAFVWLALFVSGYLLFQAATILTRQDRDAHQLLGIFYVLVSGLTFGGGYAVTFALPFLFGVLTLVASYLDDPSHDRGFLRIGMLLAVGFFFAPLTSLFFAASIALGLLGFNIVKGRFSHGVYQFFAGAVGFSLLFYPLGYYTVLEGSFGDAVGQILYPVQALGLFANPNLFENLIFYGLLLLGLGGLTLLFLGFFQSKSSKGYALALPASLILLVVFFLQVLSREPLHGSRLALCLPFLVLLLLTSIREESSKSVARSRRREKRRSLWSLYLKGSFYLPLLTLVYLFFAPFLSRYSLHAATYQERSRLSTMVKEQTGTEDRIYAWDDRPSLYRASERLAAAPLSSPLHYTASEENRTKLVNVLKENQPKLIAVNDKVSVWDDVQKVLDENYQLVQTELSDFKLYQLKQ